jgi:photolyase PhrII
VADPSPPHVQLPLFGRPPLALPGHLLERVTLCTAAPRPGRRVVYWMQGALRAHENPALDAARHLASDLGLPLLVHQALSERHPHASDRHHVFAMQGARDAARECRALGLRHVFHLERPGHRGPVLVELAREAAVVVTDEVPVEPLRRWSLRLAERSGAPLVKVDASCVVPMSLVEAAPARAYGFRQRTAELRAARLCAAWPEVPVTPAADEGELPFEPVDLEREDEYALAAACDIDHAVPPVPGELGGSAAGYARWEDFLERGLRGYADRRNDPLLDGTSRLSAHLHWGMVSPLRLARETAARSGKGPEKFLDELLVWREVAWHFCHRTPDIDGLAAVPDWARATLEAHAADRRPRLIDRETLERGRTGDALWDAMQGSLLVRGELHNNTRMTWGKALLDWTPTPAAALERLLELNHRYALDGRDPSSYGGILWCLGLFDRPFPEDRRVTGTLRTRPTSVHARRLDVGRFARRATTPPGGRLRIAVLGAGVSGLAAARTLSDAGHEVLVVDKGRGPGGRTSRRRAEPFAFDHGAQYFTARDPRFRRQVAAWRELGVVERWEGRIVELDAGRITPKEDSTERLVAVPGMNALARHLARDLDVRCGARVSELRHGPGGWELAVEDGGRLGPFDRLVMTAPPAQAADLLRGVSPLAARLEGLSMAPCWAAMLGLEARYEVELDGAFCGGGILSWVARDSSKPGRPDAEAWVLHATPEWTAGHLELAREEAATALALELERLTGAPLPARLHADAHRWMYAQPAPGLELGCLEDAERGLVVAGDALTRGRVEGAWLSGVAAAGRLLGARARELTRPRTPA